MRPKILEIEGLQSFRDKQRIDFDALGETGLFGIFGPTGSGKSTVLDAITFALYGKVKRAERGTQGIININLDSAKVAFSFELLKDGRRKTYRVERTYQRKKGSDNSCEPKIARLIEVTETGEIPVCDKASEISGSVEELIGLNHDDFTRAVVLPQNSFQEFLLLDNSKKRDMLERIFYLEEYGKQLWDKLSRKMSVLKSKIDVLSGELAGYSDATDEALKEVEKIMEASLAERARVEKEHKLLETRYDESKEVWQLSTELLLIDRKELEHLALKTGMDEKRALLDKAIKADGLQVMLRAVKDLVCKLRDTEGQMKEVMEKLPGIAESLEHVRFKHEEIRSESAVKQPELVERRARLSDALAIKAEVKGMLKDLDELQKVASSIKEEVLRKTGIIEKAAMELDGLEKHIDKLSIGMEEIKITPEYRQKIQEGLTIENEVGAAGENVKELEKRFDGCGINISGLEKKLAAIRGNIDLLQKKLDDLAEEKRKLESVVPHDSNSVQKQRDELNIWQVVFENLRLRKSVIDGMKEKIDTKQVSLKELEKKTLELQKNEAVLAGKLEESRLAIETREKEIDRNTAYRLSRNLKEGEPCPVCGSENHPGLVEHFNGDDLPLLEQELEHMKREHAAVEASFKKAEKGVLVAAEQVNALAGLINQETLELESKTLEFENEKLRLPEELAFPSLEQTGVELKHMLEMTDARLGALEARDKTLDEYKAGMQQTSDELAKERILENGIVSELKVNGENLRQSEKALNEAKAALNDKRQKYSAFLQQLGIVNVSAEAGRIADIDRKVEALQKQVMQAREKHTKDRTSLDEMRKVLQISSNDSLKMELDIANRIKQKDDRERKLKELAGDMDIDGEILFINKKLEEYVLMEKQYLEGIKALEKQLNELTARKTALEKQKEIYSNTLHAENERLEAALLEKGFSDGKEAEKYILPQERQKALKDSVSEYDQSGMNILAQKDMLVRKLNSRNITEVEWNSIENAYKEMVVYKEECVSKSEVSKSSYNGIRNKHDKWVELDMRYRELANKSGLYAAIQKLLKAEHGKDNSFIDYIAEERLRYVAAKASETLGFMTKYKYALELDVNAGFIIQDNANGGVHRMITSLSGGETFLTSLSLALALSEQIQLKGQSPLEFFFLDEGFGTLDNDLLDTVIDSLERLSSRERIIGLISHVPELKSRIARRLVVEPPTTQGDGSRVKVEKA